MADIQCCVPLSVSSSRSSSNQQSPSLTKIRCRLGPVLPVPQPSLSACASVGSGLLTCRFLRFKRDNHRGSIRFFAWSPVDRRVRARLSVPARPFPTRRWRFSRGVAAAMRRETSLRRCRRARRRTTTTRQDYLQPMRAGRDQARDPVHRGSARHRHRSESAGMPARRCAPLTDSRDFHPAVVARERQTGRN